MDNRRKYCRIETCLPLKLFFADTDFITDTINISSGGVYCRVDSYVPLMTKFRIIMFVPIAGKKSHKVECEGIVVRTEPENPSADVKNYNIAIFFSRMKKSDRAKVTDYVKKTVQNNPSWN
ncbi:MAG: PilZ domain-containing protein [Candidatus Saelkia tenebricola]|nr:PilZ domain-containing protein [Candidatus Saelkia tenebricola]